MQQRRILTAIVTSSLIAALVALRANLERNRTPQRNRPNLEQFSWSSSLRRAVPVALPRMPCSEYNGKRTESGQLIVGMSEHFTYWNQLGWFDPFSSPAYTERQNAYGTRFGLDSVYTPQMVINGEEQIVGSDNASLLRAVEKEGRPPQLGIHIVSANISSNVLTVDFPSMETYRVSPAGSVRIELSLSGQMDFLLVSARRA
jgi:hypothetical protein